MKVNVFQRFEEFNYLEQYENKIIASLQAGSATSMSCRLLGSKLL